MNTARAARAVMGCLFLVGLLALPMCAEKNALERSTARPAPVDSRDHHAPKDMSAPAAIDYPAA